MRITSKDNIHYPLCNPGGETVYEFFGAAVSNGTPTKSSLALIVITPGGSSSAHSHKETEEIYHILNGQGNLVIDGIQVMLQPGQACLIQPGEVHQLFNPGESNLEFLAICTPPWKASDSHPAEQADPESEETVYDIVAEMVDEAIASPSTTAPHPDWPELDAAIREKEEERVQSLREIKAEAFADELEERSGRIFHAQEIRQGLGDHFAEVTQLADEWDAPVSTLLTQLAEAMPGRTGWEMETKIINRDAPDAYSIYWEVHFAKWNYQGWLCVELALDRAFQPLCFWVECKRTGHLLESEPNLEALQHNLVEAFRLGLMTDYKRDKKLGWLVRTHRPNRPRNK
jgi:mannose-6-phosphate isomerase-like protein (cupin superfamily)